MNPDLRGVVLGFMGIAVAITTTITLIEIGILVGIFIGLLGLILTVGVASETEDKS